MSSTSGLTPMAETRRPYPRSSWIPSVERTFSMPFCRPSSTLAAAVVGSGEPSMAFSSIA